MLNIAILCNSIGDIDSMMRKIDFAFPDSRLQKLSQIIILSNGSISVQLFGPIGLERGCAKNYIFDIIFYHDIESHRVYMPDLLSSGAAVYRNAYDIIKVLKFIIDNNRYTDSGKTITAAYRKFIREEKETIVMGQNNLKEYKGVLDLPGGRKLDFVADNVSFEYNTDGTNYINIEGHVKEISSNKPPVTSQDILDKLYNIINGNVARYKILSNRFIIRLYVDKLFNGREFNIVAINNVNGYKMCRMILNDNELLNDDNYYKMLADEFERHFESRELERRMNSIKLNSIYGLPSAFIGELSNMTKQHIGGKSVMPEIDKVKFNKPATIVFWKDGSKTVVKCQKGDKFDKEKGLAMAITKKVYGTNKSGNNFNDILKKFLDE